MSSDTPSACTCARSPPRKEGARKPFDSRQHSLRDHDEDSRDYDEGSDAVSEEEALLDMEFDELFEESEAEEQAPSRKVAFARLKHQIVPARRQQEFFKQ